ncbi:MAG: hypothetical protein GQ477_03320 [Nanohaloarchaea archaeon]|nr:hypothetical protein [Candidatus Nanohaloarchaea archaeon]
MLPEKKDKTNEENEKETRLITKTIQTKIKKTTERSNLLAKKIQKDAFYTIWDSYKAKEDIDKMTKEEIAQHLFYLGAKVAFEQKTKDYNDIKRGNEHKKIEEMKTQKKLKEIKRNIFKIKKNKGLDIKKTIKDLKTAIKENDDDQRITEELKKEIKFLKEYHKQKNNKD